MLGEELSLLELSSKEKLEDDDQLSFGQQYYLILKIPNTLTISVISKAEDGDEENIEIDYLEDCGRNLKSEDIQIFAERWSAARCFYSIISFGGRGEWESNLMVNW